MAENPSHPIPHCDCSNDVVRSLRELPPAHYMIKIDSFSHLQQMLAKNGAKKYESKSFEASGYKWKLHLYPNGDEERNGKGYISMYLVIQDTETLPPGWEVNVNFKLFVFDHIRGKYLAIQDSAGRRRFDDVKTEWGFPQLFTHNGFCDASNGYLVHDKCVIGAEIFVISRTNRGERLTLSLLKEGDNRHTWEINKFSSSLLDVLYSDIFTLGNFKWKLQLFPQGQNGAGRNVSLFLMIVDLKSLDGIDVEFKLRIINQKGSSDKERSANHHFCSLKDTGGFWHFLYPSDLANSSMGFLVNDSLSVEVDIANLSYVQSFS